MRRFIPATLLNVLGKWLGICYTYVSWNSAYSHIFKLTSGIRQGGVLFPYLFAAYIDDLINHVHDRQIGCIYNFVNACIVMYADDMLLLAPSVHSLQILVSACESMLGQLDFAINVRKSVCIRIGPRCHFSCSPILLSDGSELQWVDCQCTIFRCLCYSFYAFLHVLLIMPRSPFTGALMQSLAK